MSLDAFPQIAGDKGGVSVSYKNAAPTQLEQVEFAIRLQIRSLQELIEELNEQHRITLGVIIKSVEDVEKSIFDLNGEFLSEKRQVRLLGEHAFATNNRLTAIEEALKTLLERRTWPIWKRVWYSLLGK